MSVEILVGIYKNIRHFQNVKGINFRSHSQNQPADVLMKYEHISKHADALMKYEHIVNRQTIFKIILTSTKRLSYLKH